MKANEQQIGEMLAGVDAFHAKTMAMTLRTLLRKVPAKGGFVERKTLRDLIKVAFRSGAISERLSRKPGKS